MIFKSNKAIWLLYNSKQDYNFALRFIDHCANLQFVLHFSKSFVVKRGIFLYKKAYPLGQASFTKVQ